MIWWILGYLVGVVAAVAFFAACCTTERLKDRDVTDLCIPIAVGSLAWPFTLTAVVAAIAVDVARRRGQKK